MTCTSSRGLSRWRGRHSGSRRRADGWPLGLPVWGLVAAGMAISVLTRLLPASPRVSSPGLSRSPPPGVRRLCEGGGPPSAEGPGPARKEAWVSRCLAAAQHDAGGFACRGCGRVEWGGRTAGLKSGRRYISLDSSCAPESVARDLAAPPCTGSPDPCMRRSARPWGQTDPSGSRAGGYLRAQASAV